MVPYLHLTVNAGMAILLCALSGCGRKYQIEDGFVSDHNYCFPDYASLPTPTLVDPVNRELDHGTPEVLTYGQPFAVADQRWTYGLQLRLSLSSAAPAMTIELYRQSTDAAEASSQSVELPDGSTGSYVTTATLDRYDTESSETWFDFPFAIPQVLQSGTTYWAMIKVATSGIAWTLVSGTNFSTLNSNWTVSNNQAGTVRTVPCEGP
jgi:hypothetical protein